MLCIPTEIEQIITVFLKNGYKAYLVGGCVRDMLMQKEPHDYDITTSATPETIISLFEKTIPTGIKHGTVTVISGGKAVEVTTFRADGEYLDCRRPASVKFVTTLKEDLERRDFTVNAMAFNAEEGLVDFFGGQNDLKDKVLRAVGNPEQRFSEDALRILRLFRFSSVLEFQIEPNTLEAAIRCAHFLKNISSERIFTELVKTLTGKMPMAIKPLCDCGGLVFTGINNSPDFFAVQELSDDESLALLTFFYTGGAEILKSFALLKSPNNIKKTASDILKLSEMGFPETKVQIKEMLFKTSYEVVVKYLRFENAVFKKDIIIAQEKLNEIIKNKEPYKISDLEISGTDLSDIGIKGTKIGITLEAMRRLVVKNPKLNNYKILLLKSKELNRN